MMMTVTLTMTFFLYLQTTADDRLVYTPWQPHKPKSLTGRLSRGLLQPKSTTSFLSLPPRSPLRRKGKYTDCLLLVDCRMPGSNQLESIPGMTP